MRREEQRKYKELNKTLPKILKEKTGVYKFKKKDYIIWWSNENLFFSLFITLNVTLDNRLVCKTQETIKPLWLDDLLWQFLKMEDNEKSSLSLRAVGAFTVQGSTIYSECRELKEWNICELEECVDSYIEHFSRSVETATIDDYISNIGAERYHKELRESLTLVHNGKYLEALNCLEGFGEGQFKNGKISIYNEIREFCENKLQ